MEPHACMLGMDDLTGHPDIAVAVGNRPLFTQAACTATECCAKNPTLRVECASFHQTYCGASLLASEKLETTISKERRGPPPVLRVPGRERATGSDGTIYPLWKENWLVFLLHNGTKSKTEGRPANGEVMRAEIKSAGEGGHQISWAPAPCLSANLFTTPC